MSSVRMMKRPVAVGELLDEVERWLTAPQVQLLQPTARNPRALRSLLVPTGVGGDLVNDAHVSALVVIDVHLWNLYDDMPVRWCNPTTTMEDFANGRAPQGQY